MEETSWTMNCHHHRLSDAMSRITMKKISALKNSLGFYSATKKLTTIKMPIGGGEGLFSASQGQA